MKETLERKLPEVEFTFLFDEPQDDETLIAAAKGAEVLITQFQFMTDRIYDGLLPELKAVVSYGIGYNSANLPVATEKGVLVCNVPNYCLEEVAVHVVSLIMAEQRRMPKLIKWIEAGKWSGGYKCVAPVKRFSKSTIGLYGYGRIARYVAKMFSGFGCRVIAYDAIVPPEQIRETGVEPVDFDTLLKESDYITLHVPLLPSTEGIFNKEAFQKMKPTAIFVNTARGALCNPEDLYDALVSGEICGAAIDAYTTEPPSGIERKILELPNVLSTPHVGYYSDDAFDDLIEQTADVVVNLLLDQDPGTVINRELWKK
ncbi:MAG: C-terminal binding protein [Oscillibacter sp.]|nr:C-terminal binding protein [Oscillibacter sp.]